MPSWQSCRLSKVPFKENLALPVCSTGHPSRPGLTHSFPKAQADPRLKDEISFSFEEKKLVRKEKLKALEKG
ncbi:Collagen Alpha-3(Iv) Chain [Manis pentadactyla]|nr:Collagen Alpha-3(Iv) Chain [Manis pentadactyla]